MASPGPLCPRGGLKSCFGEFRVSSVHPVIHRTDSFALVQAISPTSQTKTLIGRSNTRNSSACSPEKRGLCAEHPNRKMPVRLSSCETTTSLRRDKRVCLPGGSPASQARTAPEPRNQLPVCSFGCAWLKT